MKPRREILNGARTQQIKQRRKKVFYIKLYIALFLFVTLIIGLVFLSRSPKINIDKINIYGNAAIADGEIMEIIDSELSGRHLFLFPKKNIFLYPKSRIEKSVLENFQRISSADVNTDDLREITVKIEERQGKYLWCSMGGDKETCYFMDKTGFAFDQAPSFSGSAYFKFYGDLEAERDPTGQYFTDPLEFQRLIKFYDSLKIVIAPLKLTSLESLPSGDYNFSIDGTAGKIIFKKANDYDILLGNIDSAINAEPLKTDLKKKLESLIYMDLRFDNKVYFKFK